jgi:REP element-mobilizing transposase RayT
MPSLPKYNEIPIHFITCNIKNNTRLFQGCVKIDKRDKYCDIIVENLKFYRKKYGFKILSWVITPWHIHLLLWLLGNVKIENILRDFKKYSSVQLIQQLKKDGRDDLLRKFSLQEGIPEYKSSLGNPDPESKDPGLAKPRSEDLGLASVASPRPSSWSEDHDLSKLATSSVTASPRSSDRGRRQGSRPKGSKTRKFQIWQRDFYNFGVFSPKKLLGKIKYIEYTNPLKHKIVENPEEIENYIYSSYGSRFLNDHSMLEIDYAPYI